MSDQLPKFELEGATFHIESYTNEAIWNQSANQLKDNKSFQKFATQAFSRWGDSNENGFNVSDFAPGIVISPFQMVNAVQLAETFQRSTDGFLWLMQDAESNIHGCTVVALEEQPAIKSLKNVCNFSILTTTKGLARQVSPFVIAEAMKTFDHVQFVVTKTNVPSIRLHDGIMSNLKQLAWQRHENLDLKDERYGGMPVFVYVASKPTEG